MNFVYNLSFLLIKGNFLLKLRVYNERFTQTQSVSAYIHEKYNQINTISKTKRTLLILSARDNSVEITYNII